MDTAHLRLLAPDDEDSARARAPDPRAVPLARIHGPGGDPARSARTAGTDRPVRVPREVVEIVVGERPRGADGSRFARLAEPTTEGVVDTGCRLAPTRARSSRGKPKGMIGKARRDFETSAHALGFYVLSLGYPPLLIPGAVVAATISVRSATMHLKAYAKTRKFTIYTTFMLTNAGLMIFGWWDILCILSVVIAGSRYLILRTEDQSNQNLISHFANMPTHAWLRVGDTEMQVPLANVRADDEVVVRAGEAVPIDGTVIDGDAEIDEAALTGESLPVRKAAGDRVLATTMMVEGRLVVRVERSGADTTASQVLNALKKTADYKLTIQTRGEAHANAWSYPMFLAGLAAAPVVGPTGMVATWVSIPGLNYRIVAPYAMLRTLWETQNAHILVKDGRVLEALQEIDTVVFDKTGTLTEDRLAVVSVRFEDSIAEERLWRLVAAAEHRQSHPIARALTEAARQRGVRAETPDWSEVVVGAGVRAHVEDSEIAIGNGDMMRRIGVEVPPEHEETVPSGVTVVHLAVDGTYAGHLVVEARLRPEAGAVVAELAARGIRTAIISGDTETVTREVADRLGVTEFHAGVLPHEKAALVRRMQAGGRRVCFIGDGVNDAVALRQANVSISLRGATTIAVDTAHIVLLAPDLRLVTTTLGMVRAYDRRMRLSKYIVMTPAFIAWSAILSAGTGPLFTLLLSQSFMWSAIVLISRTTVVEPLALDGPAPAAALPPPAGGAPDAAARPASRGLALSADRRRTRRSGFPSLGRILNGQA